MPYMGSLSDGTLFVLDCVVSMYSFLEFYLLYCYMQHMRAGNEIKVNGSCNCQFLNQQWIL